MGQYSNAEKYYRQAYAADPDNFTLAMNFGGLRLLQKRYAEAIEAFRHASEINPRSDWAHLKLAESLDADGARDEAEVQYGRALEINPDLAKARYGLGRLLMLKGARGGD